MKTTRLPFSNELLGFLELIKTDCRRFGTYLSLLQNTDIKLNIKDNIEYTFDGVNIIQITDGKKNIIKFGKLFYNIVNPKDIEDYAWHMSRIKNFDEMISLASNTFKSFLSKEVIHIIQGNDIAEAYKAGNYLNSGTLNKSCMNNKDSKYFDLYKDYAKMLVTYNPRGQISSRALLWENVNIVGTDQYITLIDRIYTSSDYQLILYKNYARENNFYTKADQNHLSIKKLHDPNEKLINLNLQLEIDLTKYNYFPYLDTFRYSNLENKISNDTLQVVVDNENQDIILYQLNTTTGKPMKIKTKPNASIDSYTNLEAENGSSSYQDYTNTISSIFNTRYTYVEVNGTQFIN